MRQATDESQGRMSLDAGEHAHQLIAVAGEAAAAGDTELEGILRRHARLVEAQPAAAAGAAMMVRRDGTRFKLSDVRANIRRGVQARGNRVADLAKINETLAMMNRVEQEEGKRRGRPGASASVDRFMIETTLAAMRAGTFGMKARPRPMSEFELEEELERAVDGFTDSDFDE